MPRHLRALPVGLLISTALLVTPAAAHSYRDPAVLTVLDGLSPALPAGVTVALRPSVLDELVLTNTTAAPLDLLGHDGQPYLRVTRTGVLANLANPDWYLTGVPEGVPPMPSYARAGAAPRWAQVSPGATWSVFDPRVRPPVTVTPQLRAAGQQRVLTSWQIPLRYAGKPVEALGQVLLSPVLGGLVVAVTTTPPGLVVTPLQGELPGLFLRAPAGQQITVVGSDGKPFLRFEHDAVLANQASPTWRADQRASGKVVTGTGWVKVATGLTYSWLDSRLRYPQDLPPVALRGARTVVQHWAIPLSVDGRDTTVAGTVTWVPRSVGVRAVVPHRSSGSGGWWRLAMAGGALLLVAGSAVVLRRRKGGPREG